MLCLPYENGRERAQAVVSVARRCRQLSAQLLFLGPKRICTTTQGAIQRLDVGTPPDMVVRALPRTASRPGGAGWESSIEAMRTLILEASADGDTTVWAESPFVGSARESAVHGAYHTALDAVARETNTTVISALPLGELSNEVLRELLHGPHAVACAKLIVPNCPPWLLGRSVADLEQGSGVAPARASDPASRLTPQTEKLAALGQFAASVAHEAGNPLSIISSSLQYLQRRLAAANDPASDFAQDALDNVERVHDLLRSMLDFAGASKPRAEEVNLREVISQVLRFTALECSRRSVAVEVSFDPTLPPVWGDPAAVKQVVLNLVKNALEAGAAGGITLSVKGRRHPVEPVAVVEFDNDGPSIPAEVLPRLFQPFFTTRDGGTGLGLYLSRQIARNHGGELEAANLASGVRFTLTLPLQRGGHRGSDVARADRR